MFHKDEQWQADLVEVQPLKRWNGGHRYLLTVIDVLSKYAWVVPVKNKTGTAVTQAFENVLRQGRKPQRLQTDLGKEFYNAPLRRMLEREGIHSGMLQSYVERTHVSVFYRMKYLNVPERVTSIVKRVQSDPSSKYWHGPTRRHR